MNDIEEKSLLQLLKNDTSLVSIFNKLALLKKLNEIWQKQIDPELAKHCFIANERENILVVEIDNAAWATRLRYCIPELVEKFRSADKSFKLKNIEWYIRPKNYNTASKKTLRLKTSLSSHSAELLHATAENISNVKLKESLQRLARNGV